MTIEQTTSDTQDMGVADSAYHGMTPAELRKEADRRELVERARGLAERHEARLRLVEALRTLDRSLVSAARADGVMKAAVLAIVEAEKAEEHITNGDVAMLAYGAPDNWWRDATAGHPKHDYDDLLSQIERHRTPAW